MENENKQENKQATSNKNKQPSKQENKQIFEDYPEVDCNACECYWTNQCDGAPVGSEKPCKTFKATRRVDVLVACSKAQKDVELLYKLLLVSVVVQFIINLMLVMRPSWEAVIG